MVRCLGAALLVGLLAAWTPAWADALEEGRADLAAGRFARALESFERAATERPNDPEAAFLLAVAQNRLGRSESALDSLARAEALAPPRHPDLDFERGWALLRLRRYAEARDALERYEAGRPGRGQTSELLGRAHFGLGDLDAAQTHYEEALARDPALASTVRLGLLLVAQARRDDSAAREQYGALLTEPAEDPVSRLLRQRVRPEPRQTARPWRLALGAAAGHNSNVLAVGDGIALPAEISDEDDRFARFQLDAGYAFALGRWSLEASYAGQADRYFEIQEADLTDHFFALEARRALGERSWLGLRVSEEISTIDDDSFRAQLGVRPALYTRLGPNTTAELAFAFTRSTYEVSEGTPFDRDGDSYSISPALHLRLPFLEEGGRASLYAQRVVNETAGGDFDFGSNALFVRIDLPLPAAARAALSYGHTWRDYEHDNSLAGPTGYAHERSDQEDSASVVLWRGLGDVLPRLPGLQANLRWDFIDQDSNVDFYSFDQHVVALGWTYEF